MSRQTTARLTRGTLDASGLTPTELATILGVERYTVYRMVEPSACRGATKTPGAVWAVLALLPYAPPEVRARLLAGEHLGEAP